MRVLVCGPRDFTNEFYVFCVVAGLKKRYGPDTVIIEGEANGVDKFARKACETLDLDFDDYPADWSKGSYAGPKRNGEMLRQGKPDLVVAIGVGAGTSDMVNQARAAGVPVIWRAFNWIGASAR